MATPSFQKCIHCRERAVQRAILPNYTQEMEHEGKTYKVTLANFEVYQCANCGEASLDAAATERLTDALRAEVGLLAPSEIRRKREAFGLNQQQLADLLRISMYTLSRWESGGQIQKKSMDLMLRAFFDVPEFRHYVGAVVQGSKDGHRNVSALPEDAEHETLVSPQLGRSDRRVAPSSRVPATQ